MGEKSSSHRVHPIDRGIKAWTFLAAASATNIITYGFSSTFGVFREYYFRHAPFQGSQEVAYVGPVGLGLIQGLSPLLVYFCSKYPTKVTLLLWSGALLIAASSIGAAFATTPAQLILTLGVLYGFGGSFIFAPAIVLIDGWFVEKRTLANGIFFSASSLAPAVLSPLFSLTLYRYSPKVTLIGWAVFCAFLSLISLPFIQSRQHAQEPTILTESSTPDSDIDKKKSTAYRFWTQPLFYIVCLTTISQGLAHFLPALYIPTFATDFGASQRNASLLITYFNIVCIFAQPLYGHLVDRIGPLYPLLITTIVASVSILTIWGSAKSYPPLVAVMILFGASSGAFVVLRSSFATQIVLRNKAYSKTTSDLEKRKNESLISGILMSIRGVATIASGFVGRALVQGSEDIPLGSGYGAGKWKSFIFFTGIIMGAASLGSVGLIRPARVPERNLRGPDDEVLSS
ncbi:hypothetical protein COCC4DRAFT_148845 [Bipolaris maydis ATCC 48331]|uniref:Major facilitator superfamily (MFS) profile domain-containing protein n=3 Tax=Cochliobolus heterostrophus TaxID=5016 RepID=M2V3C6_COCH5|nr:uncharacterized protein COCC4DRAFT_148845 [Bipolaris maydis ATCC 48331]EMD94523.1 hypothetical protein COCHEDRAFT_1093374 [Bipolaris maydis C5]ENI01133.1 hypothetical protein COCC4DRAFT_148845 [Bipolaris maydis ATCC 48331]KAJ6209936.1 major facilitator superfamily domain-containing protein [Bipolaris maydis]KAJ6282853.1 major facilitator superfamily domain-containing protein [Bipolaris maydis]